MNKFNAGPINSGMLLVSVTAPTATQCKGFVVIESNIYLEVGIMFYVRSGKTATLDALDERLQKDKKKV